jgi:phenylpropionate dioxygenase-like ring-hydroxylating dioxygenase large terminal subunit
MRTVVGGTRAGSGIPPHYAAALSKVKAPCSLGPRGIVQVDAAKDVCYGLPAQAYINEHILEEEKSRVFAENWNYVTHISHFPSAGSFLTASLAEQEVLVVRGEGSTFRAFHNPCDENGQLRFARGTSGTLPALSTNGLTEIRLDNFNGLLFGNLSDDAPPLFAKSPELKDHMLENIVGMEDMQLAVTASKEVNANWKCCIDNFLECYHCDTAHKDFVDMVDMSKYVSDIKADYVYNFSPCNPNNTAYSFSEDAPCQAVHFYWLYPGTLVYSTPGVPNMSIVEIKPLTAQRTVRHSHRFFASSVDAKHAADRDAALEYLNRTLVEEDTMLCESMQQGMRSKGFEQGRLLISPSGSWETESALIQFQALYHANMTRVHL